MTPTEAITLLEKEAREAVYMAGWYQREARAEILTGWATTLAEHGDQGTREYILSRSQDEIRRAEALLLALAALRPPPAAEVP
jgi:hypothetical protein